MKETNAKNVISTPEQAHSLWMEAWKRLRKNKLAIAGLVIVILYSLIAFFAPLFPSLNYMDQGLSYQNLPPSFLAAGELVLQKNAERSAMIEELVKNGRKDLQKDVDALRKENETLLSLNATDVHAKKVYILGTDALGRDMLARTIYGARISILIGFVGTFTAVLIGILIGSIAGYKGGRVDTLLMRFVDIMYGLPYMLVVIILMSFFKSNSNSMLILFVAIALVSWLTIARVVRGQVISLKHREFVEAARTMGASNFRIIFYHLMPNTLGVIIVFATLAIPQFILSESFLSYLGLGISAPSASWGTLIADGVQGMELYPWRLMVPATTMTIFLFALNFLGDGLRDALDPQSKK